MPGRWRKTRIPGNNTKALPAYRKGDYTICLNLNHGLVGPGQEDSAGHHWWFEVTCDVKGVETAIGEAPTLDGAKALATRHERNA